jgi:Protein of unknown function (DUF3995)
MRSVNTVPQGQGEARCEVDHAGERARLWPPLPGVLKKPGGAVEMRIRRAVAGVHVLLALVHIYWATGASWPATDQRSLSQAVLGGEVSFAPQVVLPSAAFHLLIATAVLTSGRYRVTRLVLLGLVAGLTARAAIGVVWALGIGTDTSTPFYWLNLFVYTPACVALALADLRPPSSLHRGT